VTDQPTRRAKRRRSKPRYADADAVRDKRVLAGLSQVRLAELAGVTQPHISAIERGAASPSVAVLHALAGALGCDVIEIMYKAAS
jgi:transcriptional regulator with XRE-family HTH domain